MEAELKLLNSKPIPVKPDHLPPPNSTDNEDDDVSTKDDLPLLKPVPATPPRPPPVSAATIEELEKKFAAYVRHDVYGTMGRGELPFKEKLLLGIAVLTLVPIRVVLTLTVLVLYYLICRVCTLFSAPNREDGQEDYSQMTGWRRAVIVRSGRFLARVMLFVLGFYWIKETYRNPEADGKVNTEAKDLSEEPERPGAIISNHVSHLDILYHMSSSFPSFVAKRSVGKLPLVGLISKCLGCVYVQRESKSSDFKGVSGIVNDRVKAAHQNKSAPMMMLFPEGTTTNGDFILPFKTGAFLSKAPVLPVILKYPYERFSPAWDSISGVRHVILLLCQFVNYLEVVRLPVYYPSQQEKDNPKLYADNVRRLIACEGNLIQSDIGLPEKRIYHAALNVTWPLNNQGCDAKDLSEEPERPGAIISNHVSHLDILYHMSSSFPSFVAKRSVGKLPLVGLISKCLGCVYVQRESKSSDFKGVSGIVNDRVKAAHQNKSAPMMMLFPEGTTTNGDFILPFKTGAFLSKAPVLPVILKYPYERFSPAWDSISGVRHVILLLCQFVNYLEVVRLPVYYPSQQEKDNPKLYADNVRRLIACEGNLIQSDIGLPEKRIYHAALNVTWPLNNEGCDVS